MVPSCNDRTINQAPGRSRRHEVHYAPKCGQHLTVDVSECAMAPTRDTSKYNTAGGICARSVDFCNAVSKNVFQGGRRRQRVGESTKKEPVHNQRMLYETFSSQVRLGWSSEVANLETLLAKASAGEKLPKRLGGNRNAKKA